HLAQHRRHRPQHVGRGKRRANQPIGERRAPASVFGRGDIEDVAADVAHDQAWAQQPELLEEGRGDRVGESVAADDDVRRETPYRLGNDPHAVDQVATVEGAAEDPVRYPCHQSLPSAPRVVPERRDAVGRGLEVPGDLSLAAVLESALLLEYEHLVPELPQLHQHRVFAYPGIWVQVQDAHQAGTRY